MKPAYLWTAVVLLGAAAHASETGGATSAVNDQVAGD
jgi:hypothetical protein